jgi:selenobiotic family peptide radical SAM maturase
MQQPLQTIFPHSCKELPAQFWQAYADTADLEQAAEGLPARLETLVGQTGIAGYLPDLARLEWTLHRLDKQASPPPAAADSLVLNPAMELVEVDWHPLLPLLDGQKAVPRQSKQWLILWRSPRNGEILRTVASASQLLALKVVAEQLDPLAVAAETRQPVGVIDAAIEQAVDQGLLLAPSSTLLRDEDVHASGKALPEQFMRAEIFTLQWHITHRCDLHCRHCYDRSLRKDVDLHQGLAILDQLRRFCLKHHVGGQVSFSGGNPFLHPEFPALYRAACDRNLIPAILGNPVSEEQLDEILAIAKPAFFQVSLEGLREHNDLIRGSGSFDAVIDFLALLEKKNVYSMVMLTLTRANLDQVLPLAEVLRNRVDLFTYNRLAMVGEGASLATPLPEEYLQFVQSYLSARQDNPIMGLKDSLLNIELEQAPAGIFGGCTGYGCGAAFNFVSLLPDGQVHACRKFPSPIGDVNRQTLEQIYASDQARSYRRGCRDCADCRLRPICGGCLAVTYGYGLDPFQDRDPACFIQHDQS